MSNGMIVLPEISGDSVEAIVKATEERAIAVRRMKIALLAICSPSDFERMGDSCYLRETGANKIAPHMRVELCPEPECTKEDLGDSDYQYVVIGWAQCHALGGEKVPIVGTARASRPFFRKQWEDGTLDPGHILKAAYTNYRVLGITKATGLQNITPDELAASRVDIDKVAAVKYDDSRQQQQQQSVADGTLNAIDIVEKHTDLIRGGRERKGAQEGKIVLVDTFNVYPNKGGGDYKIRATISGRTDDGTDEYSTFIEEVAGVLLWCSREGVPCAIGYIENKKGGKVYRNIHFAARYERE